MGRSPIWVRVRVSDHGWSGRLIPGRPERICVHFHPDEGPVHLPLGTRVNVGIAQPGMANALRDEAILVKVDRRREEALECVFELASPDRLLDEVRGAVIDQRPDTRQWMRALPGEDEPVVVPVVLPDAPVSASRVMGQLIDGGAGGIGVRFPRVAEPLLCTNTTMRAQVPLPGLQSTASWVCDVRYRTLLDDDHVRYGLMFVSDGVAVDPPGPQLEGLWDCSHCGVEGLLEETHVHCPACGHRRTTECHHPSWQELATADVHPYCGTEVYCLECGVAHAAQACFCGHCGTPLGDELLADEELPTVVDG